jgi:hypothetical protein
LSRAFETTRVVIVSVVVVLALQVVAEYFGWSLYAIAE